jgi:hypothetical protein
VLFSGTAFAQQHNPIPVAVPSLQIAPDARGGGMGDIGAATMPDLYSQYWNAASIRLFPAQAGFSVAYTPGLSRLVNDIDLVYLSGFWKFGNDNLNAISASFRYFSLGDVEVFDQNTDFVMAVSPHEYAMDVAYSRRLSETFSGAVTLRYIRADYSTGDDDTTPGNAFSADISGYNESYLYLGRAEALLGFGFNLSNIGTKISYDGGNTSMFLPANLRLGASLGLPWTTRTPSRSVPISTSCSSYAKAACRRRDRRRAGKKSTGVFRDLPGFRDLQIVWRCSRWIQGGDAGGDVVGWC